MSETSRPEPRMTAPPPPAESDRDVADEDFLFHLYRGSELLQDDRVHEAKEALERALTYQPQDAKGQDLLAVVYFRLGLFARATQIYETLRNQNPRSASIRLNLAICYLKTAQANHAREELEALVRIDPDHKRAWGYLGLAYERTGDLARAQEAFDKGGHVHMAQRIAQRGMGGSIYPTQGATEGRAKEAEEVRNAADVAFQELDAGVLSFSIAAPAPAGSDAESGQWRTVEIGNPAARADAGGPTSEGRAISHRSHSVPAPDTLQGIAPAPPAPAPAPPAAAPTVAGMVAAARLVFPSSPGVVLHGTGGALVVTTEERPFAVRLEAVRAYTGATASVVLERRSREKSLGEALGGVVAPIVRVGGSASFAIAARPRHTIVGFQLDGSPTYVREEHLLGFDLALTYENGRLSSGDAEPLHVVQFRGNGTILLELSSPMLSLAATQARSAVVRRDALVGWVGRLVPRALPPGEAPAGQRGLLSFAGEGTVMVTAL